MESDARDSHEHGPSSSSAARRLAETTLLRTLERVTDVTDDGMRPAVHAFVEVLVQEGVTPEAAVIALKEVFGRAHSLSRFEPLVRDQLRTAWVSECINHYFVHRTIYDDVAPRQSAFGRPPREWRRPGEPRASSSE